MEAGACREWSGTWVGRGTSRWSEGLPQPVGGEVTRLTSIGRGTCVGGVGCEWKLESPDVDTYRVGDEVTRLTSIGCVRMENRVS